jgi:hypothetical protein
VFHVALGLAIQALGQLGGFQFADHLEPVALGELA